MQAARLTQPFKIELFDEAVAQPEAQQVLLSIHCVGICGSDMHRYHGVDHVEGHTSPLILGHEFSAVVEKTGAGVHNIKAGDRVAIEASQSCGECEWCQKGMPNVCPNILFCGMPPTDGALRQYMTWPAHLIYKLPDTLSMEQGMLTELLAVCLNAIDLAHLKPGLTAAVLGCGSIGLSLIHLLHKTCGIQNIYATDLQPYRLAWARRMGAQAFFAIDYEKIIEQTKGRGVDVVFEAAGEQMTFAQSADLAAPGGKIMVIGIPENEQFSIPMAPARRKGLTIRMIRRSRMQYPRVMQLLEQRLVQIESIITHRFPLAKTAQAFQMLDGHADNIVKAVIYPNEPFSL